MLSIQSNPHVSRWRGRHEGAELHNTAQYISQSDMTAQNFKAPLLKESSKIYTKLGRSITPLFHTKHLMLTSPIPYNITPLKHQNHVPISISIMAAKGQKFSFLRMVNNAFPNMAHDDPNDVNLSPQQADNLLAHQLASPSPRYLNEKAFFIGGIAGSESVSKKIHKSLIKHNIILPVPETASPLGKNDGVPITVNTGGVTKGFASQMAMISVHAQRKLVGMLFFWEEECTRWNLLDGEEREILSALESHGENTDLRCALEAVELKRKMLPSRRAEGTANVGAGSGHELPSYAKDL